jgi:hypothetical protein
MSGASKARFAMLAVQLQKVLVMFVCVGRIMLNSRFVAAISSVRKFGAISPHL